MDKIDWKILTELEGDGRLSFADLSERVGLSKSPCWSRVRDLEADGVIGGYHARISPAALGLAVQCYADVRIKFDGHAQCATKRLENRFRLMVRIFTAQRINMQGHAGVIDQPLKKLTHQINLECANHCTHEVHLENQPGAPGQIDHHTRERLIKRHVGMPVTAQPGFIAKRFGQRLPERNADIFDRMVRIDMQIALRLDLQINHSVLGHLIEHVIEEWHPRGELSLPGAVKIDANRDLGLKSVSANFGLPHEGPANTKSLNAG